MSQHNWHRNRDKRGRFTNTPTAGQVIGWLLADVLGALARGALTVARNTPDAARGLAELARVGLDGAQRGFNALRSWLARPATEDCGKCRGTSFITFSAEQDGAGGFAETVRRRVQCRACLTEGIDDVLDRVKAQPTRTDYGDGWMTMLYPGGRLIAQVEGRAEPLLIDGVGEPDADTVALTMTHSLALCGAGDEFRFTAPPVRVQGGDDDADPFGQVFGARRGR